MPDDCEQVLNQLEREMDKDLMREASMMWQLDNLPSFMIVDRESRNGYHQSVNTSFVTSPISLDAFSPQMSSRIKPLNKLKPLAAKDSTI